MVWGMDLAPKLGSPPRLVGARILVLTAAVVLGLCVQQWLAARLGVIQDLATTDIFAARRDLAFLLQIAAVSLAGIVGGLGIAILAASRRAIATERFPPTGWLGWGSAREVVTGPRARRLARASMVLGALLVVCSAAGAGLMWWMARALLLCRAT
jgi:hypothetical protein